MAATTSTTHRPTRIKSARRGHAPIHIRSERSEGAIRRLKAGLPIDSFVRLCETLEISSSKLAEIAGIAPRTLARRKRVGRLQFAESERLYRIAKLYDRAIEVLGDQAHAQRWFLSPKAGLGGRSPLEYSETEVGGREVEDLLGRLEHGVFS